MKIETLKTDVLIVGAGPTGLSLACQFVRFGIDFVILDKKESVTTLSKALGVHARTMEIYEQLGVANEAVARGSVASKTRLIGNGKIHDGFSFAKMGKGVSPYPYMLVLEQSKNEALLYEYLQQHGKAVMWNSALETFSQNESSVTAVVQQDDETTRTIEAKYLVGCDGASSVVRKQLGLDFEGSTEERLFYVADSYMESEFAHDTLHGNFGLESFLFFFPMANDEETPAGTDRWRILGNLPEDIPTDEEVDMSDAAIEQRIQEGTKLPLKIHSTNWSSSYRVHTRHVDQFIKGRCLLAGDAAHVHTPAGGQGMNTGIQDAYNLAWKMAFVLKGQANDKLLQTYEQERLENAKNLVESTDRIFEIEAGSNRFLGLIRSYFLPPLAKHIFSLGIVQKTFFQLISQVGISYPESPLSIGSSDAEVKAGDRMPYFNVAGESIYNKLRSPKFHLITFSNVRDDSNAANIEKTHGDWLESIVLPQSEAVTDAFGVKESFSVLVRPDNYIGIISTNDPSNQHLSEQLEQYFRPMTGKKLVVA